MSDDPMLFIQCQVSDGWCPEFEFRRLTPPRVGDYVYACRHDGEGKLLHPPERRRYSVSTVTWETVQPIVRLWLVPA